MLSIFSPIVHFVTPWHSGRSLVKWSDNMEGRGGWGEGGEEKEQENSKN